MDRRQERNRRNRPRFKGERGNAADKGEEASSTPFSLDDSQEVELRERRRWAAEILELATRFDLDDLLGRAIVWPLIFGHSATPARNDATPAEPASEYLICWLLSHAERWHGTTNPTISAHGLSSILSLAAQQLTHAGRGLSDYKRSQLDAASTPETEIHRERESLKMLAASESMSSIGVRFPIEPVLWRQYTASIYEPIASELIAELGFSLQTIASLRTVMISRIQGHVDKNLAAAREFHRRATNTVRRLRQRRRATFELEAGEAAIFAELAQLTPRQSRAAIDWHATLRMLDGSSRLVSVAADQADLREALGEKPLSAFIERCTLDAASLEPKHYQLPNPSPEILYKPVVRPFSERLLVNPLMVDYYADNIIWTVAANTTIRPLVEGRRSRFTQDKTAECLRSIFGESAVHENIGLWDPGNRRQVGEFDVLVDSSAGLIAVECKSGRWSRSAQRGSVDRKMKELYFKPLEQIGDRVAQARRNPTFILRAKQEREITVNWAADRPTIGLVVHLDAIDSLRACPVNAPSSPHQAAVDTLIISGLPYFETACQTLRSPGLLVDYFTQRGRLSADKTVSAPDEMTWLAMYLENRLRITTFSSQGFTQVALLTDTAALDEFVRSGFDSAKRPLLPIPRVMQYVVATIKDHGLQFRVASVFFEQSDDSYTDIEAWARQGGRTNPSAPQENALIVIYSADGRRAVAMRISSNRELDAPDGPIADRCRALLATRPTCLSCIMVVVGSSGANFETRDAFELIN